MILMMLDITDRHQYHSELSHKMEGLIRGGRERKKIEALVGWLVDRFTNLDK